MLNKQYANRVVTTALQYNMPIQLAKLMACQSAVETDNFTSNAFQKNQNGFGYKHVDGGKLQLTTEGIHSTETDYYAAYSSFENSIIEVCLWIGRRQKEGKFPQDLLKIQTPGQYAMLLKSCGYYGGKEGDYADGIERYLKEL